MEEDVQEKTGGERVPKSFVLRRCADHLQPKAPLIRFHLVDKQEWRKIQSCLAQWDGHLRLLPRARPANHSCIAAAGAALGFCQMHG